MSVQLIIYPQNYSGIFNTISGNPTQAIANGISFINLDNTGTYTSTSGTPYVDTITNAPPTIINTWYRYRVGASAFPTVVLADLVLNSLGNGSSEPTGIYQKMSNLTIGQQYTVTINIGTQAANGSLANRFFDGLTPQGSITTFSTTTSIITKNFTATNTEMTYMLAYYSTAAEDLTISSISVLPIGSTIADPTLTNGQVILDLYEDEDIPLTLSVDDFKNVAEKVQSYSKAFNLPATKRNNKIFDQLFEITRTDNGVIFNVYKKTECVLKQDGFTLFQGFLRLLDVTDKNGETSYNVNLYSEVVALADFLKDSNFRDLDFSELTHDYNYSNIRNSWQGILPVAPLPITSFANNTGVAGATTTNVLKYPFVDWNHQFTLDTSGNPVLPNLESAFRPFISIKYIINRIFEATPFTFTSAFFDTTDFEKLYMDFNWGADNIPFTIDESGLGKPLVDQLATTYFVTIESADNNFDTNIGYSSGVYTALLDNQTYIMDYAYLYTATGSGAFNAEFRWKMVKGGITSYINLTPISGSGTTFATSLGNFTQILNTGDTLTPEFKSATASTNTFTVLGVSSVIGTSATTVVTSATAATNNIFLQTLRGELGQWDFLKGLITMFNLVTLVDENNPNNIIIEPYSDVFIPTATAGTTLANRGVEYDWTDKIDVSEMKLTPLTDLTRKTIFKFVEDDDDYAFNQYKNLVGGHLYGSKKFNAGNEFNILDGEDEIVAEPFAATVVKPLMSQYPEFIVPSLYSYNANDDTSEGFENSPRIMFSNGVVNMGSTTYFVPCQNQPAPCGNSVEFQFLQFSHLSTIPSTSTTIDFHFGECQLLTGVGAATPNNLFNTYWLPYYSELYNPNTRIMTIKVNLTPSDINLFKFNDTVFIKNRVFRVNKIDYKPNDLATVEFILIP
jgi:hypothetical protein